MTENLYLLLPALATILSTLLWRLIIWVWLTPTKVERSLKAQGFDGVPYKLLHGDVREIVSAFREAQSKPMELSHRIAPRVMPFLDQTVKKYGKRSIQWFGPKPKVTIMEPEIIKQILTTHFSELIKIKSKPYQKLFVTGVALYEGKKWVKHKKIVHAAFNVEKLKVRFLRYAENTNSFYVFSKTTMSAFDVPPQLMLPAFQTSCIELMSKWEDCISGGSREMDVWHDLQNLTGTVISRAAFGTTYEEAQRIFPLQVEQAVLYVQTFQSIYLPGFRFLPTKRNNRMKEINDEIRAILRGIITKREKSMRDGEADNTDLLGLLMESNFEEIKGSGKNVKDVGLSIDDIIEECKLFYFAGAETSSTHIAWTLILLSMHQEWQEKARTEVLQVFGKQKPDYAGLNSLKIVTMILNEVLRLYPAVSTISRITQNDIKIGDVCLPPGVQIEIPVVLVHRDIELWGKDAEEFNPERFSEGVSKATKNQVSFIPFGWGPRLCVGQNFAMLEAKLAISMILQRFHFELSPSYAHAPRSIITLQPQYGAQIILHKL